MLQAQGHMQEAEELQQRMMPGLIYVESSALLCLVKGNGRWSGKVVFRRVRWKKKKTFTI